MYIIAVSCMHACRYVPVQLSTVCNIIKFVVHLAISSYEFMLVMKLILLVNTKVVIAYVCIADQKTFDDSQYLFALLVIIQ